MSKVLTDKELAEVVQRTVTEGLICESSDYDSFLKELARLVGKHHGADLVAISEPLIPSEDIVVSERHKYSDSETRWCVHFEAAASTPADGGIFADYDKDVSVEEWLNTQPA